MKDKEKHYSIIRNGINGVDEVEYDYFLDVRGVKHENDFKKYNIDYMIDKFNHWKSLGYNSINIYQESYDFEGNYSREFNTTTITPTTMLIETDENLAIRLKKEEEAELKKEQLEKDKEEEGMYNLYLKLKNQYESKTD